jgi:hypothetical protein
MNRAFMAAVVAAVVGWGLATGTGVAMAAGAFPEGAAGDVGVIGVAGPAGPTGPAGPAGPVGEKGLGGDTGFWRDYTGSSAVAGSSWDDPYLRSATVDLAHSTCEVLDNGVPLSRLRSGTSGIPTAVMRAMDVAAINNLCPQDQNQL